jgi:hypothetical protein
MRLGQMRCGRCVHFIDHMVVPDACDRLGQRERAVLLGEEQAGRAPR